MCTLDWGQLIRGEQVWEEETWCRGGGAAQALGRTDELADQTERQRRSRVYRGPGGLAGSIGAAL